eukprot:CAMPEP_0114108818 /NCGR_PEP_ID=MMETSP0043_2-20121206/431_1 /TAXON_ID=464988 /ORGANISM="Hemiselmis andersenii, Strain CCMP644" /LENGTH=83 /DNA_ID=CAMNT_0001200625 /DNA_START=1 /DNA_END=250 /DNA_ORIENTATION=-
MAFMETLTGGRSEVEETSTTISSERGEQDTSTGTLNKWRHLEDLPFGDESSSFRRVNAVPFRTDGGSFNEREEPLRDESGSFN